MNPVLFVFGAFAGGAVAWGLWSLLPDAWRAARWPVAIVAALFAGISAAQLRLPPTNASIERELLNNQNTHELALAWRDADPAEFAAFVEGARVASADGSLATMAEHAYRGINAAVVERLPYLHDAEIVALERNTQEALLFYADFAPSTCFAVAHGQPPPLTDDQIRRLPANARRLGERRLEILASAFRADTNQPLDALTGDELIAELRNVMTQVAAVVGEEDVQLLAATTPPTGNERRYCEVMAEYEKQLFEHPRAGPFYRGLVLLARQ